MLSTKINKVLGVQFLFTFIIWISLYNTSLAGNSADLETLIAEALQNNPEISVSKNRYEAARAAIPQAASLEKPQLDYRYDKMTASMDAVMKGDTSPMRVLGLSQEIPFPTKLIARAQIASKEAQMAYNEYKEKEREIISGVKSLYAQLALIYKSIAITKENKLLLEQLASSAATRFSVGEASQQDALKAQVEIAKMDNELVMFEQQRQAKQAMLDVLLNKDPSFELGEINPGDEIKFERTLDELNKIALENRPELKASRFAVERAKNIYSLAKQEYLPDFMVRYERMTRDGHFTDWAGMVGVTLPVWFWQKENFNVKQMKKELAAMEAEYRNEENMALFEIKEGFSRVEAYKRLVILYKTSFLPQAEQSLKSSSIGYESNKVDFLNLLDSQRMLLEFKLDYYRNLVELEIALADLERGVGVELR
ncbi:MAG: TolC family protein [Candidatus Omnitrophica bacterium]|nr:TolC family protein [Candidatus Omnitrophota bacterium]